MDRKKSLVKNVVIFGLGTSLSKLMSVLLIGLYTAYIAEDDFGYYDILVTVILMVTPMVTLQITDALYRHLLELRDENSETDAARTLSGAFAVVAGGLSLAVAVLCAVNSLAEIRMGWILPGYFVTSVLLVFSQQTARGLRRNGVYALSGVVYTGVMLAANLLFIIPLGMGAEALLFSVMIADIVGVLLIELRVGVYRRVRFSLVSWARVKEMARYSVPLLPHAVIWPAMMVINRGAILHFEGLAANGLFAAASKFPALLMTVYNIFGLAWQENAILEYGSRDRNEYYTKTFRMYIRLLSGTILLLLPATRHIVSLLLHESYYEAWRLIPFLYMGSMFQAFSNFYATVYMGVKRTVGLLVTTVLGVAGGVAVCLLAMPRIGAQAASLAHMTAFLLAWLMRVVHTRQYAKIRLSPPILLLTASLSAAYIHTVYRAAPMADLLLFIAAVPIFLWLNKDLLVLMFGMAKSMLPRKGGDPMKITALPEDKQCTGCGACVNLCEHLSMKSDEEGFSRPAASDGCNDCGRCAKVCPILAPPPVRPAPETVLAAWLTDDGARLGSSSGGFFRVPARYVLERGGVVFGAAFDGDFRLSHKGAETERDCEAFYGSKYLQSDTGATFAEAKEVLDGGRWVLYSGTPCQIAGLYGYLGGDRERLVTCEVVCNGVPSPGVFAKYLARLEAKYRAKAVSVRFKDKVKGWHTPHFTVGFANGKRYSKPVCDDAFGHGFGATLFLRPACGACPYARPERMADFTLADFWGMKPPLPEGAGKGVSLVLLNSEKAAALELPPLYQSETRPYAEAAAGNPRLSRPLKHNPKRDAFFAVYRTQPFRKAAAFIFPVYKRVGRWVKRRFNSLVHPTYRPKSGGK